MRPNEIVSNIILVGLVFVGAVAFTTLMAAAEHQVAEGTSDHSGTNTQVGVFFGTAKALSLEELKAKAREALKAKGYLVSRSWPCAINVVVAGKSPGCVVFFQDLEKGWLYQVTFGPTGLVKDTFAGEAREGVPPRGAPQPKVPEGAVPIRPER